MSRIEEVYRRHPFLEEDREAVRGVIKETLESGRTGLDAALERFYSVSGKMLRPSLVMIGARFGADFDAARMHRLAAAVELLHSATLVHDDIIDEAPLRRGIATLHTTDGTHKAVLLGDYLFTRCFRLTADFASPEAARLLAAGVGRICESEMDQNRGTNLSQRSYLRKSAGKTALLFMLSLSMGASESGCSDSTTGVLRSIGYGIGMNFQIRDDVLDYTEDASLMGKPTGSDLKRGLATLPLLMALRSGDPVVRRLIERRAWHRRPGKLRRAVIAAGGVRAAEEMASSYASYVRRLLARLPESESREALDDLVKSVWSRQK